MRISRRAGERTLANDMRELRENNVFTATWTSDYVIGRRPHRNFTLNFLVVPRFPLYLTSSTLNNNLIPVVDMDDEQRQQEEWANARENRLPTFQEVLSRRTRPPVDLFMF